MYRLLQYNDYADYATTDVRMWDFYPDRGRVFQGASFRPKLANCYPDFPEGVQVLSGVLLQS